MGDKKQCCVLDNNERCTKPACSFAFTKRARRVLATKNILLTAQEDAGHNQVCPHHRGLITTLVPSSTARNSAPTEKRKRKAAEEEPQVNFNALHMATLKRYKKHYKLEDKATKAELVEVIASHFSQQHVVELDTIVLFSHMVKQLRNPSK